MTLVTGREKIFKAPGNLWESVVDFSIEHGDQVDQTSKNSYVTIKKCEVYSETMEMA